MVIGTPMCTMFSTWQNIAKLRREPAETRRLYARAVVHLEFCAKIYRHQISKGRYFIHEHPLSASSWKERCIVDLLKIPGVDRVACDQCQFGAATDCGSPVKKPTCFMSNSEEVLKALERRCRGKRGECSRPAGGDHVWCSGMVARRAALFPVKLCRAFLEGIRNQLEVDRKYSRDEIGLNVVYEDLSSEVMNVQKEEAYEFFDDITGQPLDSNLVKAARQRELEYFENKGVWKMCSAQSAKQLTGRKPISVRWVDVNKGDDKEPNIRSRLVAREIRAPGSESVFAPTPPLEALRTVLSLACTRLPGDCEKMWEHEGDDRIQLSLVDISRAYFNAKTDPAKPVCVQLPEEHPQFKNGMCGLLLRHMYGTQRAADGWQEEYSNTLVSLGFKQGIASPCVFWHSERRIICSVHGDDFTTAGPKSQLDWFETKLEEHYELTKGGRLGPGRDDAKEGRVLNRVIRWTSDGLEYEADPRQVERLLADLELDGEGVKNASTPGVKPLQEQLKTEKKLDKEKHTEYRAIAARANYLAADRPDAQFCAKEVCRFMSAPTNVSWDALKRLGRFFVGKPRLVFTYAYQNADRLETYSDTDWAGCIRTRKSTSGGCLLLGSHVLKTWSSTQASISLSSGEAEFYGVVKASGVALGHQSLMRDLGYEIPVRVWTDSSAAMGVCQRQGLGKLRHIDTQALWIQQKVRTGAVELRKVRGEVNPGDLFTKFLSSRERIESLVRLFSCEYRGGRAESAPQLRREVNHVDSILTNIHDDHDRFGYDGPDAEMHDEHVLPHHYESKDLERMFPRAAAARPGGPELFSDYGVDQSGRFVAEPRRCFPATSERRQS